MNSLLSILSLAAISVVEPIVSTPVVGRVAANAANSGGSADSLAYNLFAFAVVVVGLIWYLMTRRAYPTSRQNRHIGPFTRMRKALGRIASFLP